LVSLAISSERPCPYSLPEEQSDELSQQELSELASEESAQELSAVEESAQQLESVCESDESLSGVLRRSLFSRPLVKL